MGWASAGGIFDPVAQGFIDGKVDPSIAKPILAKLIGALEEMDWDTQSESRDAFIDQPMIEDVFFEADSDPHVCGQFSKSSWSRGCEECGWSKRIHKKHGEIKPSWM